MALEGPQINQSNCEFQACYTISIHIVSDVKRNSVG